MEVSLAWRLFRTPSLSHGLRLTTVTPQHVFFVFNVVETPMARGRPGHALRAVPHAEPLEGLSTPQVQAPLVVLGHVAVGHGTRIGHPGPDFVRTKQNMGHDPNQKAGTTESPRSKVSSGSTPGWRMATPVDLPMVGRTLFLKLRCLLVVFKETLDIPDTRSKTM